MVTPEMQAARERVALKRGIRAAVQEIYADNPAIVAEFNKALRGAPLAGLQSIHEIFTAHVERQRVAQREEVTANMAGKFAIYLRAGNGTSKVLCGFGTFKELQVFILKNAEWLEGKARQFGRRQGVAVVEIRHTPGTVIQAISV